MDRIDEYKYYSLIYPMIVFAIITYVSRYVWWCGPVGWIGILVFGTHVDNLNALCAVYSEMAFELAQRSFDTGNEYDIAALMQSEFDELVKSGTVNKALVSETHLDFEYAKGNHNVASMRMAQVIKEGNS